MLQSHMRSAVLAVQTILALAGLAVVVGLLVWSFERLQNEVFGRSAHRREQWSSMDAGALGTALERGAS